MLSAIDVDELTQSMETLLASGRAIPAVNLRVFQAKMIAALGVLDTRAGGYTAAPLAEAQPAFELSAALAALGKGRLRLLISPVGTVVVLPLTPTPTPSTSFAYTLPTNLP